MELEKKDRENVDREELEQRAKELGFQIPVPGELNPEIPSNIGVAHTTFPKPSETSSSD